MEKKYSLIAKYFNEENVYCETVLYSTDDIVEARHKLIYDSNWRLKARVENNVPKNCAISLRANYGCL